MSADLQNWDAPISPRIKSLLQLKLSVIYVRPCIKSSQPLALQTLVVSALVYCFKWVCCNLRQLAALQGCLDYRFHCSSSVALDGLFHDRLAFLDEAKRDARRLFSVC